MRQAGEKAVADLTIIATFMYKKAASQRISHFGTRTPQDSMCALPCPNHATIPPVLVCDVEIFDISLSYAAYAAVVPNPIMACIFIDEQLISTKCLAVVGTKGSYHASKY